MIQLRGICLDFGSQKVFDDISYIISPEDRIGLVGRNGSGKSTLLKAIAGGLALDDGTVSISGGCSVAYMPQEVIMNSNKSILEECLSAYKGIGPLREAAFALEPRVESGDADAVQEYGHIMQELAELQVDQAVRNTKKMLQGLGFKIEQFNDSVTSFSVGWQMRIVLVKLLLQDADFYLFDEPTNHLDIVAKDWFLEFLKESSFGFVLVCHDRYFLDRACTTIFELERGKGTPYQGNYTEYEEEKEQNKIALEAAFRQQQKEIKHKEEIIARFKAKASKAKMAKSMERNLDKVERIELPPSAKTVRFSFGEVQRSGRIVLEVEHMAFAYDAGAKPIFKNVSFQIERGEKVAVVAPNGAGKTTLFNVLCGKFKPTSGTVQLGYSVIPAVFEQEQHKVLDPRKTVLEEVLQSSYNRPEEKVRSFLGSFLFSRDEVKKQIKVLSGGERNRVSMVKVLLQDANFLLLDEPTNHLDIQSNEILLFALKQFDGTILFVSHDHDFVNKLATRIIELTPEGIHSYSGNYEAYLAQKQDSLAFAGTDKTEGASSKEGAPAKAGVGKQIHDLKKDMQRVERTVATLEKEVEKIQESFADLEYGTKAFEDAQEKLTKLEKDLKKATAEWEALTAKQSSIGA